MSQLTLLSCSRILLVAATLCFSTSLLHAQSTQTTTEHNNMQMQGGDAPADARDPHAYSNGYTLEEGPYVLPGERTLIMADEHHFWSLLSDRFEYDFDSENTEMDIQGWYGSTYDRVMFKFEGDIADGRLQESQTELSWSHAISAYFDSQLGLRVDQFNSGQQREWLGFGVKGLAPYWFELDLTGYIGDNGHVALSLEAEYELLISQKLILQPHTEWTFYGQRDPVNMRGSGLSDAALGLRLRYEFSRQFAPYIGIEWSSKFAQTADYARDNEEKVHSTLYLAGVRFWF